MAISKTDHLWTYDDYMRMEDDGRRYEILDGELIEMPGPRFRHQDIVAEIGTLLRVYVNRNKLGKVVMAPLDVVLSPVNIVQPDILFINNANLGIITELNVQGPPDLCIEVLSPGTSVRDLGRKRQLYARFGVREYWLVDPEAQRITVLSLDRGMYTPLVEAEGEAAIQSAVLPGFVVTAAALFPHT